MRQLLLWLNEVELREPGWMLLVLLVPLAVAVGRPRRGLPAAAAVTAGLPEAPRSWRQRLRFLPTLLRVFGLLLLVVALARPTQREPLPLEAEGIDVLLCLDVSSSMTARDLDGERSRLEVAREAAAAFAAERTDDRVGLVRFARFPDVACPLTLDHEALGRILRETRSVAAEGPEDATGIGLAVARAAQVLEGSEASSKVVVLLTDGEENVATPGSSDAVGPRDAARLCSRLGVRVYAVVAGRGSRAADGSWQALDTGPVQELAAVTGGRYFEARDAEALRGVYEAIDQLERTGFREPRFRRVDVYPWFLAAALLLLVSGRALGAAAREGWA
jgi:Ca-activated chloride channel family protein